MSDAPRDNNFIPTILLESSTNPGTVLPAKGDEVTGRLLVDISGEGSGTVTSVSVVSANGFAGTVATATTTPAITLSTSITGILKGNGTAISAASAGTDYTALAFSTIAVSGQSDVVADSPADTLTLVAGSNITITTDAATDSITIAAAGSSGITIGTTTITSGTTTRILYDNAGVVGEYTITGTGTVVAMQTSPSLLTSLLMDSGFVMNWASSDVVLTHSAGILTLGTGTLKITTPTNTATSVVTIDGTQTLTNKTLTSPNVNEAVALTSTATQLNYLSAATGTTGTTSTNVVFSTSPTLTTPVLGVATATSINKITITAPATGATLTLSDGSSLITSGGHSITLTSSGATDVTLPTTGTLATLAGSETLSNKTLTAPKIANAGFIADANGNELIIFTTTASAVNEFTVANGATGNNPKITASGEANVGLDFQAAGSGTYRFLGTSTQAATLRLYEDTDDGSNYTAFKVGTQSGDITYTLPTADGSSGQFLSTNGSGTLSWASSGGTPTLKISTEFTTAGRYTFYGNGTSSFGTYGVQLESSASSSNYRSLVWDVSPDGTNRIWRPGAIFSVNLFINQMFSTTGQYYFGIGDITVAGNGHTFTDDHIGWKIIVSGGTPSLYATVAGGTETASSALATLGSTSALGLIIVVNSTNLVTFYYRVDGAASYSSTTLATNIPTLSNQEWRVMFSTSNASTANNGQVQISGATWEF